MIKSSGKPYFHKGLQYGGNKKSAAVLVSGDIAAFEKINAASLKPIKKSKKFCGKFTPKHPQSPLKHFNSKKNVIELYTLLFKDLSPMLSKVKLLGKQKIVQPGRSKISGVFAFL